MVNPYQPTEPTDASGLPQVPDAQIHPEGLRFTGGVASVIATGALTGILMVSWGWLSGNYQFNPLWGWGILFFAMNLAVMFSLRGVSLSPAMRFGCAGLLTPVAMILFVPVCFGAVISLVMTESVTGGIGNQFQSAIITVIVAAGFAIIAGVLALIVRNSNRIRHSAKSEAAVSQTPLQATESKTVDQNGDTGT